MISTLRKINAILLNNKINRPELVSMCRYTLATNWQNITEIYLAQVKILQKSFRGASFLTHTVDIDDVNFARSSPFGHLLWS